MLGIAADRNPGGQEPQDPESLVEEGREEYRLDRAYNDSLTVPLADAAADLQGVLSRPLLAYIAGVKDAKTVARWASGDASGIRLESERRVRLAYGILQMLRTRYESPETQRAWFIGMDPDLDDDSPADALHEGHLRDALASARSFLNA